jgi:hypothetical protein
VTAEQMRSLAFDLSTRRQSPAGYDALDAYYCGNQPLRFLDPEVMSQTQGRLQPLSINWARVIVGSIEERLDVEGFRLGADQAADDDLWRIWQANNLDEWSQLGHVDAMAHGRAFGLVWGNEEDPTTPRISVESARQMTVSYRPGTRRLAAAAKVYADPDAPSTGSVAPQVGWLYLPDRTEHYRQRGTGGNWELIDTLDNPLGVVPVVPLVNRPRLTDPAGESELVDVIPLIDAVNKLATDMMVSSEFSAQIRRWATGLEIPKEAQANARLQTEVREKWDNATKSKTLLAGPGVTFGQFQEAALDNFGGAIRLLVSQIAAIAGLPPHYLGLSGDNPASADAIRSAEASLVKKALRKQRGFGGSWEDLMRLSVAVREGVSYDNLPEGYSRLETLWRDPTTPTPGAKADAALKLTSGDAPIIDVDQAREDLGYTPGQIAAMNSRSDAARANAVTADVRARVDQATLLMTSQGLSQAAAFAAVGLLAAAQQISQGGPPQGAQAAAPAPAGI